MTDFNKRWPSSIFLVLFLFLNTQLCVGANTIHADQALSGDETIISSGGTFRLGFFRPGNSSNYYIGMWYDKVSTQTIVWVANRDKPISDRFSSQLKVLNGNIILINESKIPIWSTNLTSTSSNTTHAVLLDDGNFVLRNLNSSEPIWQSFDHLVDTCLPGSRLGIDKKTNTIKFLSSWKNSEDPSPGPFSLRLDPDGSNQFFLKWNTSKQYWTSGKWNGDVFENVPDMRLKYMYDFTYVTNENESYFTYSVTNHTSISRFVLTVDGQISQLTWLENTKKWNMFWSRPKTCEVYGYCGAYGICNQISMPFCSCLRGFKPRLDDDWKLSAYSGGCVRETQLECNGNSSSFENIGMVPPSYPQSLTTINVEDCANLCLSNCSCSAYAYNDTGCSIWTGDLWNIQLLTSENSGKSFNLRLAASEFSERKAASEFSERKDGKIMVIGVVLGSIAGLAVILMIVWLTVTIQGKSTGNGEALEGGLVFFGYKDLQNATKNFSEKLGAGAFGSVFKGYLPNATAIAVKKLQSMNQGEKQFRMEVSTIGTIQHINLVRLRGFCSEGNKKLLVYDYMPNGSLASHLFCRGNYSNFLDWKKRFQIALGTARALAYIHEKCRDCIIHCDIKPENILLDSKFYPKVADFGLAKLMGRDFSRVLTTVRGTRGYLAPEWISGVAITAKADVYSYGMMLFEFISGRRNWDEHQDDKVKFFPSRIASKIAGGEDLLDLIDERLDGTVNVEELNRVCRVACWCVQDDEAHRPSMGQIVQILEGILDVNLPPIPKSLDLYVDNKEDTAFFFELSSSQRLSPPSNILIASSQTNSTTLPTSSI